MTLVGAFALVALLLAGLGIYGVVAYGVSRRKAEIGIRMALGARASEVARGIAFELLPPVIAGIALGLGGAVLLSGALSGLLFGVVPHDPGALATTAALVGSLALVSSYLPARRASRVDPARSLRAD